MMSIRSLSLAAAVLGVAAFVATSHAASITAEVKHGDGKRTVKVQGYNDDKVPGTDWFVHDPNRPQPKVVTPKTPQPTLGQKPPEGAIVLFDGTGLTKWTGGKWKVENGYMEVVKGGSLRTVEPLGSGHYHIEWASPEEVKGNGQGRGNSGVIIMGRYEIQVLDSYDNVTYPDGQAASIYGQYPPDVNACLPPGQWQTYDIYFHAPQFADDGSVTRPAYVTVIHNGIKVHDNRELLGAVSHRKACKYRPHGDKDPLTLQDHGNPVRYRNIWFVPGATAPKD